MNHRRRVLATLGILTLTGALVAMEARALPEAADRAPAAVTHPAPTGPHAVGRRLADAVNVRPRQPLLLVSSESPSITEAPAEAVAERRAQMQQGLERSEARRSNDWTRMSNNAVSAYRIRISGSRHLNFTDVALASSLIVTPAERWMKMGPIDGTRGLVVTAGLVRSFFARFLLGRDDNGLLRTPHARYPEARLETAGE
jgi:hypothetical protein